MKTLSIAIVTLVLNLAGCHAGRHLGSDTTGTPDGQDVGAADLPDEAEIASLACPSAAPIGKACEEAGLRCEYGTECCCGRCYPSLVCECRGGHFACYYTDACLIPSCEDVAAATDDGMPDAPDVDDKGGGHDAVQCASSPPLFPEFDKSCKEDEDCIAVFHQINCCGTQVAMGIAASAKAAFDQAEELCRSQYPGCGCPSAPTEAEDGNTHWDKAQFGARCKSGECFSYVKGAAPRCHNEADCEVSQVCLAPGEPPPCGICRKPQKVCANDNDCEPQQVCEWVSGPCLCEPAMQCVMRCDLPLGSPLPACKEGESCIDGHCVPQGCAKDSDCPWLFYCDVSQGTCTRLTCKADEECQGGRCVKGGCYGSLGTCSYIPP